VIARGGRSAAQRDDRRGAGRPPAGNTAIDPWRGKPAPALARRGVDTSSRLRRVAASICMTVPGATRAAAAQGAVPFPAGSIRHSRRRAPARRGGSARPKLPKPVEARQPRRNFRGGGVRHRSRTGAFGSGRQGRLPLGEEFEERRGGSACAQAAGISPGIRRARSPASAGSSLVGAGAQSRRSTDRARRGRSRPPPRRGPGPNNCFRRASSNPSSVQGAGGHDADHRPPHRPPSPPRRLASAGIPRSGRTSRP